MINSGGPAFPQNIVPDPNGGVLSPYAFGLEGLSMRDYFAGHAMQSLVQQRCYPFDQEVGKIAYQIADNMIKAREIL